MQLFTFFPQPSVWSRVTFYLPKLWFGRRAGIPPSTVLTLGMLRNCPHHGQSSCLRFRRQGSIPCKQVHAISQSTLVIVMGRKHHSKYILKPANICGPQRLSLHGGRGTGIKCWVGTVAWSSTLGFCIRLYRRQFTHKTLKHRLFTFQFTPNAITRQQQSCGKKDLLFSISWTELLILVWPSFYLQLWKREEWCQPHLKAPFFLILTYTALYGWAQGIWRTVSSGIIRPMCCALLRRLFIVFRQALKCPLRIHRIASFRFSFIYLLFPWFYVPAFCCPLGSPKSAYEVQTKIIRTQFLFPFR